MTETSINQFYSFLIFIGIGILLTLIFDIFRISRKSFKTPDIVTFIEDIVFIVIASIILLFSIFKFNGGELRLYIFLGIFLGIITYIVTISKIFIKVNVIIINTIKKIIINMFKLFIIPFKAIFKFFRKLFFKPISFFFINFSKNFTNFNKKIIQITRKNKV